MKNVELVGIVESLNRDIFKVNCEGRIVMAHPSGKIRLNNIQIIEGDSVTVKVSVNDFSSGILVRRLSK